MARLSPQGKFRALDSNGDPLVGGKLFTYEAGTTTPRDTFTDTTETVANTNPVILDANGYADVWLSSGAYKYVLTDSADVTQWTQDDISSGSAEGYASTVVTQSTNLNLTSVYQNNLIVCTASLTISLLPSATATEGFLFTVKNTSAGDVTIDPDGSELIDGVSSLVLSAGSTGNVVSDGSGWVSFGVPAPVIGGLSLIQTQEIVSSVSSVDFTTGIDSTYSAYKFVLSGITASTTPIVAIQVSTDTGSTFKSGGTDYSKYADARGSDATSIFQSFGDDGVGNLSIQEAINGTASSSSISSEVMIYNPSRSDIFKSIRADSVSSDDSATGGKVGLHRMVGAYNQLTAVDAIRFLSLSGTFESGTISLYGMDK